MVTFQDAFNSEFRAGNKVGKDLFILCTELGKKLKNKNTYLVHSISADKGHTLSIDQCPQTLEIHHTLQIKKIYKKMSSLP